MVSKLCQFLREVIIPVKAGIHTRVTNLIDGNCGLGYWKQIKKKLVDMGLLKKLIESAKIGGWSCCLFHAAHIEKCYFKVEIALERRWEMH